MNTKERKMAALLLERASDEFSNHGCNDLDASFIKEAGFTDEEKVEFVREYIRWNGDPEMYGGVDKVTPSHFDLFQDSFMMSFLAYKLKHEGQEE